MYIHDLHHSSRQYRKCIMSFSTTRSYYQANISGILDVLQLLSNESHISIKVNTFQKAASWQTSSIHTQIARGLQAGKHHQYTLRLPEGYMLANSTIFLKKLLLRMSNQSLIVGKVTARYIDNSNWGALTTVTVLFIYALTRWLPACRLGRFVWPVRLSVGL